MPEAEQTAVTPDFRRKGTSRGGCPPRSGILLLVLVTACLPSAPPAHDVPPPAPSFVLRAANPTELRRITPEEPAVEGLIGTRDPKAVSSPVLPWYRCDMDEIRVWLEPEASRADTPSRSSARGGVTVAPLRNWRLEWSLKVGDRTLSPASSPSAAPGDDSGCDLELTAPQGWASCTFYATELCTTVEQEATVQVTLSARDAPDGASPALETLPLLLSPVLQGQGSLPPHPCFGAYLKAYQSGRRLEQTQRQADLETVLDEFAPVERCWLAHGLPELALWARALQLSWLYSAELPPEDTFRMLERLVPLESPGAEPRQPSLLSTLHRDDASLEIPDGTECPLREAIPLRNASDLARRLGYYRLAAQLLSRAEAVTEGLNLPLREQGFERLARAEWALGVRQYDRAVILAGQSLALADAAHDAALRSSSLEKLATAWAALGMADRSLEHISSLVDGTVKKSLGEEEESGAVSTSCAHPDPTMLAFVAEALGQLELLPRGLENDTRLEAIEDWLALNRCVQPGELGPVPSEPELAGPIRREMLPLPPPDPNPLIEARRRPFRLALALYQRAILEECRALPSGGHENTVTHALETPYRLALEQATLALERLPFAGTTIEAAVLQARKLRDVIDRIPKGEGVRAPRLTQKALAAAAVLDARVALRRGEPREARAHLEAAIASATSPGALDWAIAPHARASLEASTWLPEDPDKALALLETAVDRLALEASNSPVTGLVSSLLLSHHRLSSALLALSWPDPEGFVNALVRANPPAPRPEFTALESMGPDSTASGSDLSEASEHVEGTSVTRGNGVGLEELLAAIPADTELWLTAALQDRVVLQRISRTGVTARTEVLVPLETVRAIIASQIGVHPPGKEALDALDPFAPLLASASPGELPARVLVFADSSLSGLPLELLPAPSPTQSAARLGERVRSLTWLDSIESLIAVSRSPAPRWQVPSLLVADPEDGLSEASGARSLPMVRKAALALASGDAEAARAVAEGRTTSPWAARLQNLLGRLRRMLWSPRLLLGADATVESWFRHASEADLAILMVHASCRSGEPQGCTLSLHDGEVSAQDLARQQMQKAPLVVLLACRSGTGGAAGASLVRSLRAAGAGAVIASRWEIHEDQAVRMAADLLEGLQGGLFAGEALRLALDREAVNPSSASAWGGGLYLVGDPGFR